MKTMIDVSLAGLTFPCALRFPETAKYFSPPDPGAICVGGDPVCLSDEDWRFYLASGMEDCAHTEFSVMTAGFSDALMAYDRMIVHAVALRHRDRAYLIAGRSGVGKSTQARFLQELRPGEFSVICGDRPALEFRKKPADVDRPACSAGNLPAHVDRPACSAGNLPAHVDRPACSAGNLPADVVAADHSGHTPDRAGAEIATSAPPPRNDADGLRTVRLDPRRLPKQPEAEQWDIIVHPSPWNGKENWFGADAAPLAGLILLQRGEQNELASLTPREAAIRTYAQVIQTCTAAEKIRRSAELTTRLLNSVPIWQLTTYQVPDSTRLLLESVF